MTTLKLVAVTLILSLAVALTCSGDTNIPNAGEVIPHDARHPRYAKSRDNLDQCLLRIDAKKGGWCELRVPGDKPGISAVWPGVDARVRQKTGPRAVLIAWNSAAYDEVNRILYFMGGGHGDYGGNEVYSFSLQAGEWRRLTEPSKLEYFTEASGGRFRWIPDTELVPGSVHTYDGLIFRPETGTLILLGTGVADGAVVSPADVNLASRFYRPQAGGARQYEFNPSADQVRNGMQPLSWRKIGEYPLRFPRSVRADKQYFFGSSVRLSHASFDNDGSLKLAASYSGQADYGDGFALYDKQRKLIWSLHRKVLFAWDMEGKIQQRIECPRDLGMSAAFDSRGRIISWNGVSAIYSFDPDAPELGWKLTDWGDAGPITGDRGRVYGKWVSVGRNTFVGVSNEEQGIWVYKHPE